jgi:hypothetical protein
MTSDPAAIATSSTSVEIAAVTTDGSIYLRKVNTTTTPWTWSAWTLVSNGLATIHRVALASQGTGMVDLFVRAASDQRLWHTYRSSASGSWNGWLPLGGELTGGPGAMARSGHVDVFGIDDMTLPHAEVNRGVRYRHYPR